jgi:hypothetical protein
MSYLADSNWCIYPNQASWLDHIADCHPFELILWTFAFIAFLFILLIFVGAYKGAGK